MARDPLAAVSTVSTPQTQRIPGRIDQVRNNAGGYVIGKDLWTKLEDFLVLGTTGGTYYLREDRLTEANVDVMLQAIQEDGPRVVRLVTDISAARPPRARRTARPCSPWPRRSPTGTRPPCRPPRAPSRRWCAPPTTCPCSSATTSSSKASPPRRARRR